MRYAVLVVCCSLILPLPSHAQFISPPPEVRDFTPSENPTANPSANSQPAPPATISLDEAVKKRPLRFIEVEELPPVGQQVDGSGQALSLEELRDPNLVPVDEHFQPTAFSQVKLHGIRKLIGKSETLSGKLGEVMRLQDLEVVVHQCRSVMDQGEKGFAALVDVSEVNASGHSSALYRGWLLSTSPSLTSLQHPQYDLLLAECSEPQALPASDEAAAPADTTDSEKPAPNPAAPATR